MNDKIRNIIFKTYIKPTSFELLPLEKRIEDYPVHQEEMWMRIEDKITSDDLKKYAVEMYIDEWDYPEEEDYSYISQIELKIYKIMRGVFRDER